MLFRQLIDPDTSTYTYLLADEQAREAILIDPVRSQVDRDLQILDELGLKLVATLETHVHADHITGAYLLKERTGSAIVYPEPTGVEQADRLVGEGDTIAFGNYRLEARLTPGHTDGCATYVCQDNSRAFTGDALLIRGSGRTDFQQGDARKLYRSVHDQIFSLPDDTLLFPGHDYKGRTVSSVREEKLYNQRLGGGKSEDQFVQIMDDLGLPYPRYIDEALPANLELGKLDGDPELHEIAHDFWSEVKRSATGTAHVGIDFVQQYGEQVRLLDVRSPAEYRGPLGHVEGSELVPLHTLFDQVADWDRSQPIVTICRSGGRSDRAADLLEQMGFHKVASMVGGMNAWTARHGANVAA